MVDILKDGLIIKIIIGLVLIVIVAGVLLYILKSRTNAVEKTGFGSLIMLGLVSVFIPIFWILQGNWQTDSTIQLHTQAVERGRALYLQYCTYGCFGIKDSKIVDAKYNGFLISTLNEGQDDDLRRIIAGGIFNPEETAPSNANLIPKSDKFGGTLLINDVEYLLQFIRSADASYLEKHGFANVNEVAALPDYLQNNNPALYKAAEQVANPVDFGPLVDKTTQTTLTIHIVTAPAGKYCQPACFEPTNVQVKVGTVITWVNDDTQMHTVTAMSGTDVNSPKPNAQIFDSGTSPDTFLKQGATYSWTVTQAAYTANPDHTLIYYCFVHPTQLAKLTIVP